MIGHWSMALTEKERTLVCREVEEVDTKTCQLHHALLLLSAWLVNSHGVTQFLHIPKQEEDALRLSLRQAENCLVIRATLSLDYTHSPLREKYLVA